MLNFLTQEQAVHYMETCDYKVTSTVKNVITMENKFNSKITIKGNSVIFVSNEED